ncbi:polyprenol monophosphomannose synthase [Thermoflexus sp.]|uniref:polyprenol monophosphomannose synthase n=1 Tax=Thermoflexus sp. TaxID=1969742 RepID=UPI0025F5FBB4|nr:polyprenol monophosphomannose synthase [Thermoflexus sp.]MDW8181048.1 polyprenol monophosphomannose synthase [Anaerolineae bacterium]MCS6964306.1 polyprenol monophosphomannose synthase [Thermoflexus sp.]MCS7351590.1 polyprenol monophosphomannose synthase [Thermoflexus sp.]MCX7689231.1 polyprenol monophosphomannose synthase [Thermoflexus sp.]MDW8183767.1 polyprenol monophosphomannose synthase [Anaerolineae bacterium]
MGYLMIIPTYNERENIEALIRALLSLPLPLEVLVVDDHSPDGTGELVAAMAAADPRIHVIHRPAKLGLGTAYVAGFRFGLARGYERILTMDADFSHDPMHVPALIERSRKADLVIGSRYVPGGRVVDSPWYRRLLSRGANRFARTLLRLTPRDVTAGFRCYHPRVLRAIAPETIRAEGYAFLIEITYRAQRAGFRIAEVPIRFKDRRYGRSKVSRREIARALWTVLRLSWDQVRACGRAE